MTLFCIFIFITLPPCTQIHIVFNPIACIISFDSFDVSPVTYVVDEDDGPAQPVLVLSNPSSTDITVQVFNTDGSATGEY